MESKRQHKIAKLIQQDLASIMQQEARDYFNSSLITVTKVYVSPDLGLAKAYLSLFATTSKEELLKKIQGRTKEIRTQLAHRIRHQLRVIPQLTFMMDDSLDYIENIESLLDE